MHLQLPPSPEQILEIENQRLARREQLGSVSIESYIVKMRNLCDELHKVAKEAAEGHDLDIMFEVTQGHLNTGPRIVRLASVRPSVSKRLT